MMTRRPLTFSPGDPVHLAALGKGTVREVRNGGRYLVDLKGHSIVVAGAQLAPVEAARPRRVPSPTTPDAAPATDRGRLAAASTSIDLHGHSVVDGLEALERFLNAALLDGRDEIRIIHGRSGGRLRAAVHARLRLLTSIRAFRLDPRNPGATIVSL